jgi:hypothetical protein
MQMVTKSWEKKNDNRCKRSEGSSNGDDRSEKVETHINMLWDMLEEARRYERDDNDR